MIALPRGAIVAERRRARTPRAGGPDATLRVLVRVFCRGDARKAKLLLELIDPRRDDRSPASIRAAAARAGMHYSTASRTLNAFCVAIAAACLAEDLDPARYVRVSGTARKADSRAAAQTRSRTQNQNQARTRGRRAAA